MHAMKSLQPAVIVAIAKVVANNGVIDASIVFRPFTYDGKNRCDLCFVVDEHSDVEIDNGDILAYALTQLKRTREDLEKEMVETEPERYKKHRKVFECKVETEHGCCGECERVAEDHSRERGRCCKVIFPGEEDKEEWCEECTK